MKLAFKTQGLKERDSILESLNLRGFLEFRGSNTISVFGLTAISLNSEEEEPSDL
jgi:hypothetical protein